MVAEHPSDRAPLSPPALPAADRRVRLDDGRVMAFDDRGDPDGVPVLFLHGTPDCRLARHPDDALAADTGCRLLAVDRPGLGDSDPAPGRTTGGVVEDLIRVLDECGVDRVAVFGWSAGALPAAALAATAPERVSALAMCCPAVPPAASLDEQVAAAAGDDRRGLWAAAAEWGAEELADEIVPYSVPHPITWPAALAHAAHGDPVRSRELALVPGGLEQMALGVWGAVHRGLGGVRDEFVRLYSDPGFDLGAITAPVALWSGADDPVTPPAFGDWWARRCSAAASVRTTISPGHSHASALVVWSTVLAWCAAPG